MGISRKIYNEVIIDMNPESPSYGDHLYEDSFQHDGPMMLMERVAPDICNDGDTSDDCCFMNQFVSIWGNEYQCSTDNTLWDTEYCGNACTGDCVKTGNRVRLNLGIPTVDPSANAEQCHGDITGDEIDDYAYTKQYTGFKTSGGNLIAGFCCWPNGATEVTYTNDPSTNGFFNLFHWCGAWDPDANMWMENSCNRSIGLNQNTTWNFDVLDLGNNGMNMDGSMFLAQPRPLLCSDDHFAKDDGGNRIGWFNACTAAGDASAEVYGNSPESLCACPNDNCNDIATLPDSCVDGIPCDTGVDGGDWYCNSSEDFMSTPIVLGAPTCNTTDMCGVCAGPGLPIVEDGYCEYQSAGEQHCNCTGGCMDACGMVCEGGASLSTFSPPESQISNVREWYQFSGSPGLYFCECGPDGTADTATAADTTKLCYVADSFDNVGYTFYNCGEDCPDGYVDNATAARDMGCMDEAACNYNSGYMNDCSDCEANENGEDCFANRDDSCCVYPNLYCVADGSEYPQDGTVPDAVFSNNLCDVNYDGLPFVETYCPLCETLDPGCGNFGYSISEANQTSPAWLMYGGVLAEWLIPDGPLMGTGMLIGQEIPSYMLDGVLADPSPGQYLLYGCQDPAALNYGGESLFFESGDLTGQSPVTTCQYCPAENSADAITLGCPEGYDFYWEGYYTSGQSGVTNAAKVMDPDYGGQYDSDNPFHLPVSSTELNSGGGLWENGACFCRKDLAVLEEFNQTLMSPQNNPLFILDNTGGKLEWDSYGRLSVFETNTFNNIDSQCASTISNCKSQGPQFGMGSSTTLPVSFGNLTNLTRLNLSYNFLNGPIPQSVGGLSNLTYLDLSFNEFNSIPMDQHYTEGEDFAYGLCRLMEDNGMGMPGEPDNRWLWLMGNKICPEVESVFTNEMAYPYCLVPPVGEPSWEQMEDWHQQWVYDNLGFIELPDIQGFNIVDPAQFIIDADGNILEGVCLIKGCTDQRARNYWSEATADCGGNPGGGDYTCCDYDGFYHFPWGEGAEGAPPSFGGGMTKEDMVKALHANQYGFQYNSLGDMDVTGYPVSFQGNCDGSNDPYLPSDFINNCNVVFSNDPNQGGALAEFIDGNGIITHWDGIWLRDSGYTGIAPPPEINPEGDSFYGDARPLEFINRIEREAFESGNEAQFKSIWFGQFFPLAGLNLSMFEIDWLDDYDLDGSGGLDGTDANAWRLKGRDDIANMIQGYTGYQWSSEWPYPVPAPDDVELWETTAINVSMSYSQKFKSEADAGFQLYPEAGSAGTLTRSGQWQCDDGGDSSICYEDIYACGRAPDWIEECTPCGQGNGVCVPLTIDTAAEGHHKISKTKTIPVKYFHGGNSNTIIGNDIYTASLDSSNHPYYFSVINGDPNSSKYNTQFNVSWGHYAGSGSEVNPNTKGTSEAIYKQYASMLLDDKSIDGGFLISSGSDVRDDGIDGNKDEWIYVLNFNRKDFEDQLQNGTWTLTLSGSSHVISGKKHWSNTIHSSSEHAKTIELTDDSLTNLTPPIITDAGRRFNIVSGSNGTPHGGYNHIGGRYGFFYPDAGLMVFGEKISHEMSGSNGSATTSSGIFASVSGSEQLYPSLTSGSDRKNSLRFINCMKNVGVNNTLNLSGEKEVTEVNYLCVLNANDFNFTNNFSIITGSGRTMFSTDTAVMNGFPTDLHDSRCFTGSAGEASSVCSGSEPIETITTEENEDIFVWPGSGYSTMHDLVGPTTFVTGVQLYDEHGEMVAIASLSKPMRKAFDREVVIKVKLSY